MSTLYFLTDHVLIWLKSIPYFITHTTDTALLHNGPVRRLCHLTKSPEKGTNIKTVCLYFISQTIQTLSIYHYSEQIILQSALLNGQMKSHLTCFVMFVLLIQYAHSPIFRQCVCVCVHTFPYCITQCMHTISYFITDYVCISSHVSIIHTVCLQSHIPTSALCTQNKSHTLTTILCAYNSIF